MCQLAAAESELIMVDTWEAEQSQAQRSLLVLQRIQQAVQQHYKETVSIADAASMHVTQDRCRLAVYLKCYITLVDSP